VSSKGEAVWELIRTVESAGYIDNPGQVLEIIMQRERQGGLTLGDGIAIPHGRLPELREPVVALGIMPEGEPIQIGGSGDQPVDIMYLVLSPTTPHELHLQVLAAIAKLLRNREVRQQLRSAKDPREAMEIINQYSKAP
jgi:PTS system nitrogen regulatory IIA component